MRSIFKPSLLIIVLLALTGYTKKLTGKTAFEYTFDGFKLGTNYAKSIQSRPPYLKSCDDDPIDKRNRRFMIYTAKACRNLVFPGQTSVMFYIQFSQRRADRYNQPVEAFAYLNGTYFNGKTDFPLKPGDQLKKMKKIFGNTLKSFEITRKKEHLMVHKFKGDIYGIANGDTLVGFVFGPMPDDGSNEQWRGLMQIYQRYTPKSL